MSVFIFTSQVTTLESQEKNYEKVKVSIISCSSKGSAARDARDAVGTLGSNSCSALPGLLTGAALYCPSLLSSCSLAGGNGALGHLCLIPPSCPKYHALNLSPLKPVGVDLKRRSVFWHRVNAGIDRKNRDPLTIKPSQTQRRSLIFCSTFFTAKEESVFQLSLNLLLGLPTKISYNAVF